MSTDPEIQSKVCVSSRQSALLDIRRFKKIRGLDGKDSYSKMISNNSHTQQDDTIVSQEIYTKHTFKVWTRLSIFYVAQDHSGHVLGGKLAHGHCWDFSSSTMSFLISEGWFLWEERVAMPT